MSNRDRRPPETEIREAIATDETIVELYWKRDEAAIRLTDEKYGTGSWTPVPSAAGDGRI